MERSAPPSRAAGAHSLVQVRTDGVFVTWRAIRWLFMLNLLGWPGLATVHNLNAGPPPPVAAAPR